jgi:hemerythrin-like domain-containing protein
MHATEILMDEHTVILRVIAALETATQRAEHKQAVRPGFFLDAADFIKGFADGCHHRKEEGVLFKAMSDSGMPTQGGPIAVMLMEHEQGRAYTRGMRQAAEKLQAGDESARQELVANARGYAALLTQHIAKENGILFPMADQVIPPARHAQVAQDFEHVEHAETGEGVHEKYLARAESLEKEMQN